MREPVRPPAEVPAVADYLAHARDRLPDGVWQYLQSGAGGGRGIATNAAAFEALSLTPRPLAEVRHGTTAITLFGETLAHPVLLAPIAYQRLFHPDGECASAMAAVAQEGTMVVSSLASQTLEQIAAEAERPLWFQLYWQGDRPRTLRLLQRAVAAGYRTVVFTVDSPVKQAGIELPTGIAAVNLEPSLPLPASGPSRVFGGWMAQAPTWDDLVWLRAQCPVPLLVKGILHPRDAEWVVDAGCDGVVVSSHGGRVLEDAPASLAALPTVLQAVAGRVPVLLDSGIRAGQDVAKALALGADAVMLGRPYIWGLTANGALGVAHVIRLLRDELEMTMALCGAATLAELRQVRCAAAGPF